MLEKTRKMIKWSHFVRWQYVLFKQFFKILWKKKSDDIRLSATIIAENQWWGFISSKFFNFYHYRTVEIILSYKLFTKITTWYMWLYQGYFLFEKYDFIWNNLVHNRSFLLIPFVVNDWKWNHFCFSTLLRIVYSLKISYREVFSLHKHENSRLWTVTIEKVQAYLK